MLPPGSCLFLLGLTFIPGVLSESVAVCENEVMALSCPSGHVISVSAANYGRTDDSTCPIQPIRTTSCSSPHTANVINAKCNNLQSCFVTASNSVFGDPCAGTVKYLRVVHSCVKRGADGPAQSTGVRQSVACENEVLSLGCPEGKVIRTVKANYGRTEGGVCPREPIRTTNCVMPQSGAIVTSKCDYKQTCLLTASNNEFGDPCHGTVKYLDVSYECISRTPDQPGNNGGRAVACENDYLTVECRPGYVIEVTDAYYGRKDAWTCPRQPIRTTSCAALHSVDIVKSKCNNQQNCILKATNGEFGDPCEGTVKYLQVEYRCLKTGPPEPKPTTTLPTTTTLAPIKDSKQTAHVCQNEKLTLECSKPKRIIVYHASYGRSDRTTCEYGPMNSVSCDAHESLTIVYNKCDGQHVCAVYAESELFGDPCPDTFKYLSVTYGCI